MILYKKINDISNVCQNVLLKKTSGQGFAMERGHIIAVLKQWSVGQFTPLLQY
jgi:hypothetical protein